MILKTASLKSLIAFFGILLTVLFASQAYFTIDPHKLRPSGLNNYERFVTQNKLLKEFSRILADRHTHGQNLPRNHDTKTIGEIDSLNETLTHHLGDLKKSANTGEWTSAYETLENLNKGYADTLQKLIDYVKTIQHLKAKLLNKSAAPILKNLEEAKLLTHVRQQQKDIQFLWDTITGIQKKLSLFLKQDTLRLKKFPSLDKTMESVTKKLTKLMQNTQKKAEVRTELERTQNLILNYLSSIHQMRHLLVEIESFEEKLQPHEKLLANFIHDLETGLQGVQKELFQELYEGNRHAQRASLFFTGVFLLITAVFFALLFYRVHRPLREIIYALKGKTLDTIQPLYLKDLQALMDTLQSNNSLLPDASKEALNTLFMEHYDIINNRITMLTHASVELGKVSSSISQIPKIFDKKFSAIHKANDQVRSHFRHVLKLCEMLEKSIHEIATASPKNASVAQSQQSVQELLEFAHKAAIESQTLGLRFNSLIRTKEDTLEVSRLFGKAGNQINKMAHGLQKETSEFFQKLRSVLSEN